MLTLAAATISCASGGGGGGAAASCVGPLVSLSSSTASPGEAVTVSGEWLHSGCDDGGGEEEQPYTDVAVVFLQAARSTELARVDAHGDRSTATVQVTVPVDAAPGAAAFAFDTGGGPCPPAVGITIDGPGRTAAPLAGTGSRCGRWPASADGQLD